MTTMDPSGDIEHLANSNKSRMHDAPSLLEAPPLKRTRTGDDLSGERHLYDLSSQTLSPPRSFNDEALGPPQPVEAAGIRPDHGSRTSSSSSRKDTQEYTTIQSTMTHAVDQAAPTEMASSSFILTASPMALPTHNVLLINDESEVSRDNKRRRRTGPLNEEQRTKANLIRKIRACAECHKRRVACHPSHQGTTWEALEAKYGNTNANPPESVPQTPRGWTPANGGHAREYHTSDVEGEPSPSPLEEQAMLKGRTPLPTAPRSAVSNRAPRSSKMSRSRSATTGSTSHIHTLPDSSRYIAVDALLLSWVCDDSNEVDSVAEQLQNVLATRYNATCVIEKIPSPPGPSDAYRWLSDRFRNFVRQNDRRDVLKIIYYNGNAHLNRHADMVLTDSPFPGEGSAVRWPPLQTELEESPSDILILFDCPYFAVKHFKSQGVMEVLAASTHDSFSYCPIPRCAFTKAIIELLKSHADRRSSVRSSPLSVTDLHMCLVSRYPAIVRDLTLEHQVLYNFPNPVHILAKAEDAMAISIQLTPEDEQSRRASTANAVRRVNISLHLDADADLEPLKELFRLKPESVRHVQIEDDGPIME